MLFYCSSFDSFSLALCTFKHRKGICTYLSSYLPRLHNKLDYVCLNRNLYIDYVHLSRNLHIHYVPLVRILYIHYVRLRPTFILFINHEDNKRNSHDDGDDDNDYDDNFSCTCVAKMRTTKATVMATAMATIVPECNLIISDRTMWVEDLSSIGSSVNIKKPSLK